MAVAGRLAVERPEQLADCFSGGYANPNTATLHSLPSAPAD
jgi:hypothetical protein